MMQLKYSKSIFNEIIWQRTGLFFLSLSIFLISFPRSWALWPLGIFLIAGLIKWLTNFKILGVNFLKEKMRFFPLIFYFLLYFQYFTSGTGEWKNVEEKLMFLLIPVFGFPFFISDYFIEKIRLLFFVFISGIVTISIFQISRVTFESISYSDGIFRFNTLVAPGISRFNWDQISIFEHPTYLSIKTLWAVVLILFAQNILKLHAYLRVLLLAFLLVFLFFLSVKAGILILAFLLIFYSLKHVKRLWGKISILTLAPLLLLLLFGIARHNLRINQKIMEVKESLSREKVDFKNFDPRTRSWSSSINLIKEKPILGYGLEARDKLSDECRKNGFITEADLRLNSHNQFLETQLTFGIFGTAVLLWILIALLTGRKRYLFSELIIPFFIIISVSMIFESIFERQWGIMFFVIFYCFLVTPNEKAKHINNI